MKRTIIAILVCCLPVLQYAQQVQEATLKDGSVLTGFIKSQDGKGNMVFETEEAILVFGGDTAKIQRESQERISDLSAQWRNWAENNHECVDAENKTIKMANVKIPGREFSKVKLLGKGTKVRFLEICEDNFPISWAKVHEIKGVKRQPNVLSGIMRHYTLKNGVIIEGEYAGESSSDISVFDKDGVVVSFPKRDVVKFWITGINPNQNIFDQSLLLDVVATKNGPVRGVIIEQNYTSSDDKENYILVQNKDNGFQTVKMSEVKSITKEKNPTVDIKYDVILKPGEALINGLETNVVEVAPANGGFAIDSLGSCPKLRLGDKPIQLQYHADKGFGTEGFKLVKLFKSTRGVAFGKKIKNPNEPVFAFTYKNLVDNAKSAESKETSVNNTTSEIFAPVEKGEYILYDSKNKLALPFIVE